MILRGKHIRPGPLLTAILLAGVSLPGMTQTLRSVGVPGRGAGSVGVTLQYVEMTERELIVVREKFGKVTSRSAYFEFDYGLTDRMALTATLPLKSIRYAGPYPHDPSLLRNDHGEILLDDGAFHTNWGDLGLSLRWLWRNRPLYALTPFVSYYTPSNDYPLYTETQAGRGQWRVDAGMNAMGSLGPPRLNMYWRAGYAYSYLEKVRPTDAPSRRVNRSTLSLELGWQATPLWTTYLVVNDSRTHNGLYLPEFIDPFVSDQFYHHDQLLPWEQTTWSLGAGYTLSDRIGMTMSYGRSGSVEFGHFYQPAISVGLEYGFSSLRGRDRAR